MIIRPVLQANSARVFNLYISNKSQVRDLQSTLIHDILPSMADELQLDDESINWAKEWLEDTVSMFQIARKQNFTRSFAMESMRKHLLWRLQNIRPYLSSSSPSSSSLSTYSPPRTIHCLPTSIQDPFGRPIIILRITQLTTDIEETPLDFRAVFIPTLDRLRLHLKEINRGKEEGGGGGGGGGVALQYVMLLDLEGVSIQSVNVDLLSWAMKEVIPKFPSMIAAVFLMNYSWTHAGLWSVVKHLLPQSALEKVFFPTQKDLVQYFGEDSLPQEYGGSLPSLKHLPDPLRPTCPTTLTTPPSPPTPPPTPPVSTPQPQPQPQQLRPQPPRKPTSTPSTTTTTTIDPTSHLNPYFGYPSTFSSPANAYSTRRTVWSLVRTLGWLFWEKWGGRIKIASWIIVLVLYIRLVRRRR